MKKLYYLDEQEKQRILNLHTESTKRQYLPQKQVLSEQKTPILKQIGRKITSLFDKKTTKIPDEWYTYAISSWDSNLSKLLQSYSKSAQNKIFDFLVNSSAIYNPKTEKIKLPTRNGTLNSDIDSLLNKKEIVKNEKNQYVVKDGKTVTIERNNEIFTYEGGDVIKPEYLSNNLFEDISVDVFLKELGNVTDFDSFIDDFEQVMPIKRNFKKNIEDLHSELKLLKSKNKLDNPGYITRTTGIEGTIPKLLIRSSLIILPIAYIVSRMYGISSLFFTVGNKTKGVEKMKSKCKSVTPPSKDGCKKYAHYVQQFKDAFDYNPTSQQWFGEGTNEEKLKTTMQSLKFWQTFCEVSYCCSYSNEDGGLGYSLPDLINAEIENDNDYKQYVGCPIIEWEARAGDLDATVYNANLESFWSSARPFFTEFRSRKYTNPKSDKLKEDITFDTIKTQWDNFNNVLAAWAIACEKDDVKPFCKISFGIFENPKDNNNQMVMMKVETKKLKVAAYSDKLFKAESEDEVVPSIELSPDDIVNTYSLLGSVDCMNYRSNDTWY